MKLLKKIISISYSKLSRAVHMVWAVVFPKWYAKYYYNIVVNKKLNLKNPRDYNEKVQWLKIYSDTSQWTDLADKYKVRKYIEQCGLNDILVKLYGVWSKAEDIDFSELPDKFVLKTNNGCGKNILVFDKKKLDIVQTRKLLNSWVKERTGLIDFQPHMWNIDRKIIAEELLQDDYNIALSSSLIDYKIFNFHGEPEFIDVIYDRKNTSVGKENSAYNNKERREKVYDLNWNPRSDVLVNRLHDVDNIEIPKPTCLDEMIQISRVLSKPFPQVRVDLYEVNNKVYFGELTFTPGGMTDFIPQFLIEMGDKIDLSKAPKRRRLFII